MSSLFQIRENTHNTRGIFKSSLIKAGEPQNLFSRVPNKHRPPLFFKKFCTQFPAYQDPQFSQDPRLCYRAPFLWANKPPEYKIANSLNMFKRKTKSQKGQNCPCRLCKTYVRELDQINFSSQSIYICHFLFSFLIHLKKTFNAQPFSSQKKTLKIHCKMLYYHPSILISVDVK